MGRLPSKRFAASRGPKIRRQSILSLAGHQDETMPTSLACLLQDHQRALAELTREPYNGPNTPEVRAILIKTCKDAIEHIKRDIEDGD
jgi:hypothetical protein